MFQIRVLALVRSADRERMEKLAEDKKARLEDSVNTVIRSAELNELNEPGLETLKRRLKHELGRVFGDDQLITEVLIPQLLQSGPGV
jgi:flagellar basal body-associated protein FliL